VRSPKPKEDSRRPRGFADALVWIIVLIILTPLVIAAVLALYQRFF
jgi:Tfp pilus assembly protein PilX